MGNGPPDKTPASQKTALYLRLSREDEEKNAESESIANQRAFLLEYARANGFGVAQEFIDDGWSGTTFDRPGFSRMVAAIEAGKIDTVLTKDLSRLGRDYIQTGHFLERYFPEHGVRYIAVNDGIDTGKKDGGEMTPFLSVVNDLYARDISKKVRSALDTKKRCGKFIGSTPPYGYRKDPADKNRLVPDPETASVVREIYRAYQERVSLLGVAKHLTERGIPTPRRRPAWSDAMVRRILTNPTYRGDLTQNRSRKINYKLRKKVALPRGEWITVPGTHEALISKEAFDNVQRLLSIHGYTGREKKEPRLLSGLVFCACGARMTFLRQGGRVYLVCGASRRGRCASHCIRVELVEKAILEALRAVAAACPDAARFVAARLAAGKGDSGRERLEKAIASEKTALAALYRDKANGALSPEEYGEIAQELRGERVRLERLLADAQHREMAVWDPVRAVERFLRFEGLERPALLALVERVVVGDDKSLAVTFRFRSPER